MTGETRGELPVNRRLLVARPGCLWVLSCTSSSSLFLCPVFLFLSHDEWKINIKAWQNNWPKKESVSPNSLWVFILWGFMVLVDNITVINRDLTVGCPVNRFWNHLAASSCWKWGWWVCWHCTTQLIEKGPKLKHNYSASLFITEPPTLTLHIITSSNLHTEKSSFNHLPSATATPPVSITLHTVHSVHVCSLLPSSYWQLSLWVASGSPLCPLARKPHHALR